MATIETTATTWEIDAAGYHVDRTAISNSSKEVYRDSPKRYHAMYIAGTLERDEPTPQMILGSAVHLAILERDLYESGAVVVSPKFEGTGSVAARKAWKAENGGNLIITAEQAEKVRGMREAVLSDPNASLLLGRYGRMEHAIRWQDEATGLSLKSRRDKETTDWLADIKATPMVDPESFAKHAFNMGWHRQASFYVEGERCYRGAVLPFVFIAVSPEPPHDVGCHELDEEFMRMGREENEATLLDIRCAINSGRWDAPYQRQVNKLGAPRWAFNKDYK